MTSITKEQMDDAIAVLDKLPEHGHITGVLTWEMFYELGGTRKAWRALPKFEEGRRGLRYIKMEW